MTTYEILNGKKIISLVNEEVELVKKFQEAFGQKPKFFQETIQTHKRVVHVEIKNFLTGIPVHSTGLTFKEAKLKILRQIFPEKIAYREISLNVFKKWLVKKIKVEKSKVIIPVLKIENEVNTKVLKDFEILHFLDENTIEGIANRASYRINKKSGDYFNIVHRITSKVKIYL